MKITFLSEMRTQGVPPANYENMRTEFAWMHALYATHHNIYEYGNIKGYDHVFVIFPKGRFNLNAVGAKIDNTPNLHSELLGSDWLEVLKKNNEKVHYIQEGPTWMFTELEIRDQFNFYNMLASVDTIYAHNQYDTKFYKGLVPGQKVRVMPTLMIEELIGDLYYIENRQDKAIVGGNFARWYGGFQSYVVADEFKTPIWAQESHAKREGEEYAPNLQHLPRLSWFEWMKELSTFKYAVHLMPTIAAGTFSLNCAYFGIPCIGNKHVDTQRLCHPDLSVDVEDVDSARRLAKQLKEDRDFYTECAVSAKRNYRKHYDIQVWRNSIDLK
jgi:hypothetical protein